MSLKRTNRVEPETAFRLEDREREGAALAALAGLIVFETSAETLGIVSSTARHLSAEALTVGSVAVFRAPTGQIVEVMAAATWQGVRDTTDPLVCALCADADGRAAPCAWTIDSRCDKHRSSMGLFAAARAVTPMRGDDAFVVVELSGRTAGWRATPAHLRRCLFAAAVTAEAIDRRVQRPGSARDELLDRLTRAQRAVALRLVADAREEDIASAMNRSPHTIHDHIKGVFKAWNVHTRAEALWRWSDPLHARWAERDRAPGRCTA
ncbi:MAG: hypothetical protein D6693_06160 [Planctomycetota bacterium]|nr:MAG: hypothetical protein D6693_06160 [Planctomycetota bacterium]